MAKTAERYVAGGEGVNSPVKSYVAGNGDLVILTRHGSYRIVGPLSDDDVHAALSLAREFSPASALSGSKFKLRSVA